MIDSYEKYLYFLEADKMSLGQERKKPKLIGDLRNEIWKFQRLLRKIEYLKNCKKGTIYKLLYYINRYFYEKKSIKLRFEIPLNVCGAGLCLCHGGTIIINGNAKIGENCRIHSGVNIGCIDNEPSKAPIIGNNVYIGPGVKVYGDIEIADGIVIGANSVVGKSFIIPNITIGGIMAKKISDRDSKSMLVKGTNLVNII